MSSSSHSIQSQVSGRVWKVECPTGATVQAGDCVVIVESMKMEIPHEAPASGSVTVLVAEGDLVQEGQLLATLA